MPSAHLGGRSMWMNRLRLKGCLARPERLFRYRPSWATLVLFPWFVAMNAVHLGGPEFDASAIGSDARLYYAGASAWVHGGDPWSAVARLGYHFTGPPPTVLAVAPFTLLPEDVFVWTMMGLSLLAAVWLLWRLRLPGWWLLFPPLVEGILPANPHVVVLALLLTSWTFVTPWLKVYAAIPLILTGRWRPVILAGALMVASMAMFPGLWMSYAGKFTTISQRLLDESVLGFSAARLPALALPTAFCLVILLRLKPGSAAWLAVPALWPAAQFHYASFALPVITPTLALFLAIPFRGGPGIVVVGYTVSLLVVGIFRAAAGRHTAPEPATL